ncbi:Hypothetical predicted protein [Podarcis lilfordi]|uniref:Inducible T-cell costimulator n=1 Tax=Podarcis lilfordi TaxID=74358 RepID=A0AA35NVD9_9SAUR|nr:Hypothetical predicted protein [Podarcis lilfordi]
MKLYIVTICLFCFCFEPLHGGDSCSSFASSRASLKGNLTASSDEFPRENFTFDCPLPHSADIFHIKLFRGQHKEKVCDLYIEKGKPRIKGSDICNPVHSGDKVSFVLRDLKSKHSDTYISCLEIYAPVPHCCETIEKHLYIQEDAEDSKVSEDSEVSCLFSESASWILIGLTVFSVVACIFCFTACCLRNVVCRHVTSSHDYNNEYMSMAAVKPI